MKDSTSNSETSLIPAPNMAGDGHDRLPVHRAEDYFAENSNGRRYNEEASFNWRNAIAMVVRRRKLIISIFATVVILSALRTRLMPRTYKATTQLLVKSNNANSAGNQLASSLPALGPMLQFTQTDSQDTEIRVLQSTSVMKAALARISNHDRDVLKAGSDIAVTGVRGTDVIEVSVTSRDPKAAMALSNAICDAYREQGQKDNTDVYQGTAHYVQEQLSQVESEMNVVARQLRDYKEANHIVDLDSEGVKRIDGLASVMASLQSTKTEQSAGEAQLAKVRSQLTTVAPNVVLSTNSVPSPVAQQIQAELTKLEVQRIEYLQEFTPQSPELRALDKQISNLRGRLIRETSSVTGGSSRGINPIYQSLVQTMTTLQGQNLANAARARALTQTANSLQESLKSLPARQYDLGRLQLRLTTLQSTYANLADKLQTLRISQEAPVDIAKVISPADFAISMNPGLARTLPIGIFLGLILSLGVAAALEYWDDRIYSEEDVQDATGLSVLCQVPMLKHTDGSSYTRILPGQKTNLLLESYRMLRTHLAFAAITAPLRSIVVTSSQPHEGKSTAAVNLATVLALDGKTVILVDCDLRNPSLHRNLGLTNQRGFTSILSGTATLEECLQPTEIENMKVLTAGPMPPNPPELLNSKAARDLILRLRDSSDIIIIDTPPSLIMSDAPILANDADGTVFVVSSSEAGKREVARTVDSLRIGNTRLLGVILNKIDLEVGGYFGYYGSYGYFKKYGQKYENYGLSEQRVDGTSVLTDGNHDNGSSG